MKLAIISEVCGNLVALQKFLSDATEQKVDHTLCLGNIVAPGPRPRDCFKLTMEKRFIMTQGESEFQLARGMFAGPMEEDAYTMLNYALRQLGDVGRDLLKKLPLLRKVFVTNDKTQSLLMGHASLLDQSPTSASNNTMRIYNEFDFLARYYQGINILCLGNNTFPIFMSSKGKFVERNCDRFGQKFHLSAGTKYLINPGSIGRPAEGGHIAKDELTYAVIEADGQTVWVTFRRVKYDLQEHIRDMKRLSMPDSMVRQFE